MNYYSDGTISVANGSQTVTGVGTAWATALVAGGTLIAASSGLSGIVLNVVSDTEITLKRPWPGATISGGAYDIQLENADAATAIWSNQTLAEIIARIEAGTFLDFDATGTLAERAAFDGSAKGFVYCQDDVAPFLVYIKQSATSGDWSAGASLQGADGTAGTLNWRTGGWVTATAYAVNDGLAYNGESYRCSSAHTSGSTTEPGIGASWATVWELAAAKGTNGATGATGSTVGVSFGYSTTTTDADPGAGLFRFNNATIASVTAAYIDNADNAANSVTAWLDTFDDSTNTVKGTLMLRGVTTPAAWAVFEVTGSVVDGTGYRKLTLTHKGSGGTWTNADVFAMDFCRAGDAGAGAVSSVNGLSGAVVLATKDVEPGAVASIASAGTLNLSASLAARYLVTGTTTITAITLGNNRQAILRFAAGLTLTHNATTLILPTGANILTEADDVAEIETDGSGNVRVTDYQRKSGKPLANDFTNLRERLTANRTYYVRTDGSDSNTGLVDSAGGAFLTLQKSWDVVASLDLFIYTVTVQVRDGTYTGGINATTAPVGGGSVTIQGNSGTPSNVVVSTTSADAFKFNGIYVNVLVKDLKVQTTTSGYGIQADGPGINVSWQNIDCGACANDHIYLTSGASGVVTGNYSITGAATSHIRLNRGALLASSSRTVTLTGTLNFANGFIRADASAQAAYFSSSFTGGTITGTRYVLTMLGGVNTFGGGANYFPGNAAGTTATGAQYA